MLLLSSLTLVRHAFPLPYLSFKRLRTFLDSFSVEMSSRQRQQDWQVLKIFQCVANLATSCFVSLPPVLLKEQAMTTATATATATTTATATATLPAPLRKLVSLLRSTLPRQLVSPCHMVEALVERSVTSCHPNSHSWVQLQHWVCRLPYHPRSDASLHSHRTIQCPTFAA